MLRTASGNAEYYINLNIIINYYHYFLWVGYKQEVIN